MESFNKENIIISQDDISTPLRKRNSSISNSISPLRDKSRFAKNHHHQHHQQQFLNSHLKESFILPDNETQDQEEFELLVRDYQNLERQIASLMIQNNTLNQDNQNFEMELLLKEKDLLLKSSRINELVIQNRKLEKNLQLEIRNNEQNYSNWTSLKQQYENKISNLNNRIKNFNSKNNLEGQDTSSLNKDQITIQILNKKLKSLKSDYELEKNSKMLIIDEFEIIKQNYLNLELSYNLLKNDFEKLQKQNGSLIMMGDDDGELEKHQQQDSSFQSDSSYGDDDVENVYTSPDLKSVNNNPHTTTLADELLESETKYHHNQELIKLNFQIKSLNLQNEKLYSYIGYLLQSSLENGKEYSDEKLIKIAKRKLVNNKILRSVSSSLQLHQNNRTEHPQQLTVYPDHATNEEMSLFMDDGYDNKYKKIYNIKSTANLKKLHFSNSSVLPSSSFSTTTVTPSSKVNKSVIMEHEFENHHLLYEDRMKLSILQNMVGEKFILKRLNLTKFLIHGIIEFIEEDEEDEEEEEEYTDESDEYEDEDEDDYNANGNEKLHVGHIEKHLLVLVLLLMDID